MLRDPRNKSTRGKTKKYSPKTIVHPGLSEEELHRKLKLTLFLIVGLIFGIILLFVFLGPMIGSLLGSLSVHRNDVQDSYRIAPPAPILSNVPTASNKDTITINGFSEAGSSIKIFLNGPVVGTTIADKQGSFTVGNLKLINGKNTLYAKSENQNGNESDKSQTYTIIKDNKKPEIKITEPLHDSTVSNLNSRVTVKGSINEKAQVFVNDRKAIVRGDNTFELLLGVKPGDVDLKVKAIDEAGNEKIETIKIKFVSGN